MITMEVRMSSNRCTFHCGDIFSWKDFLPVLLEYIRSSLHCLIMQAIASTIIAFLPYNFDCCAHV